MNTNSQARERFTNNLRKNIKKLRVEKGFSQDYLARYLGLHQAAISRIETGAQKLTAVELGLLSKLFSTSIESMIN